MSKCNSLWKKLVSETLAIIIKIDSPQTCQVTLGTTEFLVAAYDYLAVVQPHQGERIKGRRIGMDRTGTDRARDVEVLTRQINRSDVSE
jgi:hypothetical protein